MKALISPLEKIYDNQGNYLGERIAQVEPDDKIFPVAEPLYWTDCADDVTASEWYYDEQTQSCQLIPIPVSHLQDASKIVY